MAWINGVIAAQRGHLFPWLAVAMAIGIGCYFALRFEPPPVSIGLIAAASGLLAFLSWLWRETLGPLCLFCAFVLAGFAVASNRAHSVAGPVLGWHYYGAIEGRVIGLDRSASDAVRVTLDEVVLFNTAPERVPIRVRISLHGDAEAGLAPQPGMRIMTTGHLSPPGGPVEPGGFDFQRHSWFLGLGAVGYTRVPLVAAEEVSGGWTLWVFRLRMRISEHVQKILPGDVGGFAAAVTTGDRSAISQGSLEALRAANTAHLLAISGLHMGLLSGFVFSFLRLALALVPAIALRWPARNFAAGGALIVAALYLLLSGGNVSTERAFIMVAVALCAIMINRHALSMRAVAIAALIVLAMRPEALLGPGFQMSFAATTALVAVFQRLRHMDLSFGIPMLAVPVGVLLSSAVAGLATAPIGAAHFNAVAHYGLLANFLSVPLMGALIIPAAVISAMLWVIGLEIVGLWVMGLGLEWILNVSHWVASLDGARSFVPGPGPAVLPMLALGALFVILWRGQGRWLGLAPMAAAFWLWTSTERPALLIAEKGDLVGLMTEQGRALSKARGAGFVATNWLENDGDPTAQPQAAARWPKMATLSGHQIVHLNGKRAAAAMTRCAADQVVVSNQHLTLRSCMTFDPGTLRASGAVAFFARPDGLTYTSVRQVTGTRLWSQWPKGSGSQARTAAFLK